MKENKFIVGLEAFTAVVMKIPVFWDITLCSSLKFNRRFRGTCRLHIKICWLSISRLFLAWLILRTWRWKRYVSPKRWLAFNGLLVVISYEISSTDNLFQNQNSHYCTGCGRCHLISVFWRQKRETTTAWGPLSRKLWTKGFPNLVIFWILSPLAKIIITHVNSTIRNF
jgi:hypothetical protein